MFTLAELDNVVPLVRASVPPTPQYAWPLLKARTGVEVVVKHENHTPIGAFKVRGGVVYLDRLKRERPHVQGIVTATRGNHGQSLAFDGRAEWPASESWKQNSPLVRREPTGRSSGSIASTRRLKIDSFGRKVIEGARRRAD
jgi:Pyridoxal-phosphate dependent enzyme